MVQKKYVKYLPSHASTVEVVDNSTGESIIIPEKDYSTILHKAFLTWPYEDTKLSVIRTVGDKKVSMQYWYDLTEDRFYCSTPKMVR